MRSLRLCCFGGGRPDFKALAEFVVVDDGEDGAHVSVASTAELAADDVVIAIADGSEPHGDVHAGNGVLGDEMRFEREVVDHVLGGHLDDGRAVAGEDHF